LRATQLENLVSVGAARAVPEREEIPVAS